MNLTAVLARHTDSLMTIPGVIGVGEGRQDGAPTIEILVVRHTAELRRRLPPSLEGYRVHVVETGVVEAQPDSN
jgi:hypothetical protein